MQTIGEALDAAGIDRQDPRLTEAARLSLHRAGEPWWHLRRRRALGKRIDAIVDRVIAAGP